MRYDRPTSNRQKGSPVETLNYVTNILKAYFASDDEDRTSGATWYDDARATAHLLDPDNVERAAGVIAAMSPLMSWPQNLIRATEVYQTGTTRGMGKNVRKAVAIYNGGDPKDILRGPKVTSFYANIMGDVDGVTVDRHAIDAAIGKVLTDKERTAVVKATKSRDGYDLLRTAYKMAADILAGEGMANLNGAQLQAVVWVYWRKNHAQANHG